MPLQILQRHIFGAFRCGNKPLVLPGVKDGFSKAKTGELKASPKG